MARQTKRLRYSVHKRVSRGFTLMEVIVALVIVAMVLGGLIGLINSQVDARYEMRQRFLGQTVAWNRLLEQYRQIQGWNSRSSSTVETKGDNELYGRTWYWELDVQETFGEDFYRYEVKTFDNSNRKLPSEASLVAYFVD